MQASLAITNPEKLHAQIQQSLTTLIDSYRAGKRQDQSVLEFLSGHSKLVPDHIDAIAHGDHIHVALLDILTTFREDLSLVSSQNSSAVLLAYHAAKLLTELYATGKRSKKVKEAMVVREASSLVDNLAPFEAQLRSLYSMVCLLVVSLTTWCPQEVTAFLKDHMTVPQKVAVLTSSPESYTWFSISLHRALTYLSRSASRLSNVVDVEVGLLKLLANVPLPSKSPTTVSLLDCALSLHNVANGIVLRHAGVAQMYIGIVKDIPPPAKYVIAGAALPHLGSNAVTLSTFFESSFESIANAPEDHIAVAMLSCGHALHNKANNIHLRKAVHSVFPLQQCIPFYLQEVLLHRIWSNEGGSAASLKAAHGTPFHRHVLVFTNCIAHLVASDADALRLHLLTGLAEVCASVYDKATRGLRLQQMKPSQWTYVMEHGMYLYRALIALILTLSEINDVVLPTKEVMDAMYNASPFLYTALSAFTVMKGPRNPAQVKGWQQTLDRHAKALRAVYQQCPNKDDIGKLYTIPNLQRVVPWVGPKKVPTALDLGTVESAIHMARLAVPFMSSEDVETLLYPLGVALAAVGHATVVRAAQRLLISPMITHMHPF